MKRCPLVFALTLLLLAPVARAQTPFGNAILFDGANQYVAVTNFGSIIPTNEITVEFWAYTTAAQGQSAFILDPDSGQNRLNAHINYGTLPSQGVTYWDFGSITGGGRLGPVDAPANSVGNWVHYAFVASQSGNYMSIYTNGVLMATQPGMTPFVRGTYDLDIGGGSNYFSYNGGLDDFRVWNVARTQADIQSDFDVTLTGSEPHLVVYYRFDSGSGAVATNSATATGTAFNGMVMGNPQWITSNVPGILVTNAADSGAGTLRAAISNAVSGTTITFAANLSGATIILTNGEIVLATSVTIDASSLPQGIQISGNANSRIFAVEGGVTAQLNSLVLTNGASSYGGAIENNGGTLTINNSTLVGNHNLGFGDGGGAIANEAGNLALNNCTLTGNQIDNGATDGGGAIAVETGSLAMNNCTVTGNQSPTFAGGIFGGANLTNCVVAGNVPDDSPGGVNCLVNANPQLAPLGNYGGPTPTMPPLPGSPAIDAGSDSADAFLATDQRGYPRLSGAHVDIGAVEVQIATQPPALKHAVVVGGAFQFGFTNLIGGSFSVFSSTNLALPFNQWSNLGTAVETPPGSGNFQFTDPQAPNGPRRFYRVRSP
jgi:hypothetical protein